MVLSAHPSCRNTSNWGEGNGRILHYIFLKVLQLMDNK